MYKLQLHMWKPLLHVYFMESWQSSLSCCTHKGSPPPCNIVIIGPPLQCNFVINTADPPRPHPRLRNIWTWTAPYWCSIPSFVIWSCAQKAFYDNFTNKHQPETWGWKANILVKTLFKLTSLTVALNQNMYQKVRNKKNYLHTKPPKLDCRGCKL